jgi:hypothetical protein
MNREEAIKNACECLYERLNDAFGENPSQDIESLLEPIEAEGWGMYPVLVGIIADSYFEDDSSNHLGEDYDHSRPRWEAWTHNALKQTVGQAYELFPNEEEQQTLSTGTDTNSSTASSRTDATETGEESDGLLGALAGAADTAGPSGVHQVDEDIVTIFENKLKTAVSDADKESYTLFFPLNFRECVPDSFTVNGHLVSKLSNAELKQELNNWEIDSIEHEGDTVAEYLDKKSIGPEDALEDMWWQITLPALSKDDALADFIDQLEILLGKLNLSIYYYSDIPEYSQVNRFITEELTDQQPILEKPPIALIKDDAGHKDTAAFDGDISTLISFNSSHYSIYKELNLDQFPRRSIKASKQLESGLQGFLDGLQAETCQGSFFGYWRALEDISHKEAISKSAETIDRVNSILSAGSESTCRKSFKVARDTLADRRNSLVHNGSQAKIVERDVIMVREIFIEVLPETIDLMESQSLNDQNRFKRVIDSLTDPSGTSTLLDNLEEQMNDLKKRKDAANAAQAWSTEKE